MRKGLPRGGNVRLGEPEDGFCGIFGMLCLSKGKLRLVEPVIVLRLVFMACLVLWLGLWLFVA